MKKQDNAWSLRVRIWCVMALFLGFASVGAMAGIGTPLVEKDLSSADGAGQYFKVEVPPFFGDVHFSLDVDSGDPDLFVARNHLPTGYYDSDDDSAWGRGIDEFCSLSKLDPTATDTYHILVKEFEPYDNATLTVTMELPNQVAKGYPAMNLSANQGETLKFVVYAGVGGMKTTGGIRLVGGTGDADLHVWHNLDHYGWDEADAESIGSTSDEFVQFDVSGIGGENGGKLYGAADVYYVEIRAWKAFSGVTLSVDYNTPSTRGSVARQVWRGIPEGYLENIAYRPFWEDLYELELLPSFATPVNDADHFIAGTEGFFRPPVTGDYIFSIAGDSGSAVVVADVSARLPGATNVEEWDVYPEQQSDPVFLTAGSSHLIYANHTAGTEVDHLEVAMETDDLPRRVIDGEWVQYFYNEDTHLNSDWSGALRKVYNGSLRELTDSADFETSTGGWDTSGRHCKRVQNPGKVDGDYCLMLKNGQGWKSSTYFDIVWRVSAVYMELCFVAEGFEGGEGFAVEISEDGGQTYEVQTWFRDGRDFISDGVTRYHRIVVLNEYTSYWGPLRVRIQCHGSDNGDRVYIDNIAFAD